MNELYLTIAGANCYYGMRPFAIGNVIRCQKEPSNPYDAEAICCTLPMVGTVGYVANSVRTVCGGTMSAGRLYDKVPGKFYAKVLFTSATKVICRVELENFAQLEDVCQEQTKQPWYLEE